MAKAQCPKCGCQEVRLVIEKTAKGVLDDEGHLESATDTETIVKMTPLCFQAVGSVRPRCRCQ